MSTMPSFLPLTTPRLTLRSLRLSDLEDLHAFLSLSDVARYHYWEPMDRETVATKLTVWITQDGRNGRDLNLGIEHAETGKLIGYVVLLFRDAEARQGEIGFTLNPEFQKSGFGFEAGVAVLAIGFEHYHLHRIYGRTDVRNVASYALMEKLGMRREAHFKHHALFKGGWDEEYYYAMLENEWRERALKTAS